MRHAPTSVRTSGRRALKIVIADDEPLARKRLEQILKRHSDLEIVGTAGDGAAAVDLIRRLEPDLAFLDIAMPGLNGLEAVALLEAALVPAIVFVTAHDHFALDAFREGALDYVMKPVDPDRLAAAIARARRAVSHRSSEDRVAELRRALDALAAREARSKGPRYDTALWVQGRTGMVRVPLADVLLFGVEGDYAVICTRTHRHLIHESLRGLEERLDPALFARVHRQAIVRIDAVAGVERTGLGTNRLRLSDGRVVPVGRTYRQALERIVKGS